MSRAERRQLAERIATLRYLADHALPVTVQAADGRRAIGHVIVMDEVGFIVMDGGGQETRFSFAELAGVGTYNTGDES